MISFVTRQALKTAGGIFALAAMVVPSAAFAQRAGTAQQQPQFVRPSEELPIVENVLEQDSACSHPTVLMIPEGESISRRAERRIQDDMLQFITDMDGYLDCILSGLISANSSGAGPVILDLLAVRYNSAITELETMHDVYVERVGPIEDLVASAQSGPLRQRNRVGLRNSPWPSVQQQQTRPSVRSRGIEAMRNSTSGAQGQR